MLQKPFSSNEDLKKGFWKNIHFGTEVVWCGVNWKLIHFSKAPIPPSVDFSILFLQIILMLNLQCCTELNQLCSRKQHRQHLPSLLYKSFFYMVGGLGLLMVYSSGLTNVSVCLDDDM